ncbi:MAG: nucleoside permease [Halieaceae bacterium]|nr:nucleoside permease [Halieaceae bacterium]
MHPRLCLMMFLQFMIWGIWAVTLGSYLGLTLEFSGAQIGAIYGTTAIASILSPLLIGWIADRYFPAQKIFGCLHLAGAAALYLASTLSTFNAFYAVLLVYALCYMPTLSLANTICFRVMTDTGSQFPRVRVFGTIGWIVAGLTVGVLGVETTRHPLQYAALVSLALSMYSLCLPSTPAAVQEGGFSWRGALGLDAITTVCQGPRLTVFVCSGLISIPLAFYYNFANLFLNEIGMEAAAAKMTLGQISEAIFMLFMPFMFRRAGVKAMLTIGMLAWVLRYGLFAWGAGGDVVAVLYLGIILHGVCYDFFFVTGQVYMDRAAPEHLRASMQSVMTLITYGLGMLIGAYVSGFIVDFYTALDGTRDWQSIWAVPAVFALLIVIAFVLLFHERDVENV